MALTLLRKLEAGTTGDFQWFATYRYTCPNAEADGHVAAWLGMELSVNRPSAIYVPVCVIAEARKSYFAGQKSLVTLKFQSLRRAGTAIMRGAEGQQSVKAKYNLDGQVIEGDLSTDGVNTMRVATGSNLVDAPAESLVVNACYSSLDLSTPRSWKGKVNASYLPKMGAQAEILRLRGYKWYPVYAGPNTRFYFDYYFQVTPYRDAAGNLVSWNQGCTSKSVVQAIVDVAVYGEDSTGVLVDTGDTSRKRAPLSDKVYIFSTGELKDAVRQTNRLFNTASFSTLDNMIII